MARKLVLSLIAIAVFFSFSLGAAASPIEAPATASPYATASTLAGDPDAKIVPAAAYVASFAVGIVAGLVANFVYDVVKHVVKQYIWGFEMEAVPILNQQAELIFDY
jgi:hypothetical protein